VEPNQPLEKVEPNQPFSKVEWSQMDLYCSLQRLKLSKKNG